MTLVKVVKYVFCITLMFNFLLNGCYCDDTQLTNTPDATNQPLVTVEIQVPVTESQKVDDNTEKEESKTSLRREDITDKVTQKEPDDVTQNDKYNTDLATKVIDTETSQSDDGFYTTADDNNFNGTAEDTTTTTLSTTVTNLVTKTRTDPATLPSIVAKRSSGLSQQNIIIISTVVPAGFLLILLVSIILIRKRSRRSKHYFDDNTDVHLNNAYTYQF